MRAVLLLLLCFLAVPLFGQDAYSEEIVNPEANAEVHPTGLTSLQEYTAQEMKIDEFDKTAWKKVIGTTSFDEKPPEEKKASRTPSPRRRPSPWTGAVIKILAYIIIIGLVIAILYYVLRNIPTNQTSLKNVFRAADLDTPIEDISSFDMNTMIRQALDTNNLRLAIRINYLGLLKKLNEQEKIVWKKDKTNMDYLMELFSRQYHYDEIRQLTLIYETVWYGERSLTQSSYDELVPQFESMQQQLNISKAD